MLTHTKSSRTKKVTSLEDIDDFIATYGVSSETISELELKKLAEPKSDTGLLDFVLDDCGVKYSTDYEIVLSGANIVSYKIREQTIAVANNAFYSEKGSPLESLYLPNTIICIGDDSFRNCDKLSNVSFPESLLRIGNCSFFWCLKLVDIHLNKRLKYIGTYAFGCSSINSIQIPKSVERIGSHAFSNCNNLEEVIFEGIPKELGSGIFDGCKNLKGVVVPYGTKQHFEKELFPINSTLIKELHK